MFPLRFRSLARLGVFLAFVGVMGQSPDDSVDRDRITAVVKIIASRDRKRIVQLVRYPLGRGYPVKPIRSAQECLKRFDEVFDEALLSEIAQSSLADDWGRVGWRGIIFKSGALWLNDDYKISAINHETKKAIAVRAKLIAEDKKRLPLALRDFDEPELEWVTSRHLVRVDQKGDDYRLTVFQGSSPKKLLFMLHNGTFRLDGQLGACFFDWHASGRTYRVYSSGGELSEDRYYIYDQHIDESDWPDHAAIEEHRRK